MKTKCITKGYPHNSRCRCTHGFLCTDCGEFFAKESAGYARYELPSSLSMVIHNIRADALRADKTAPEVEDMLDALRTVPREKSAARRKKIIDAALAFIAAHDETPESATVTLR